jgi:phosphoheptose isomerase
VVEHYLDTVGVSGSNPLSRTIKSRMRSSSDILQSAIAGASKILHSLIDLEPQIARAADLIGDCLTSGSKLLVCGNGGSAADAADFCTEFACRFVQDRRPYPALNLAQGGSLLTATGNDYGFDEVFARQVAAFGVENDLLVCLTTSGKSKNVRRALEEGKKRKLKTIALLGRDGGSTLGIADLDLVVPGRSTARIQEAHKFILHVLCEIVEARLPRA